MPKNEDTLKDPVVQTGTEAADAQAEASGRGRRPKEYSLLELEEKDLAPLMRLAGQAGVPEEELKEKVTKHDVIFKILEAQGKKQGLLFSAGVLEGLEEGL